MKRREEKEENNKKRSKNYKKLKKLWHMVALLHNLTPKKIAGRISQAAMGGAGEGTSYFIASVVHWKERSPGRGRPKFDRLFGVAMNPKRRVRAAHGRAREAKTH